MTGSIARPARGRPSFVASIAVLLTFGPIACDNPNDPGNPGQEPVEPRIVFSTNAIGGTEGQIYSARLDGSDVQAIGGRTADDLAVSPDGRQIAYSIYVGSDDGHDIFILDVATGEERRLTSGSDWNLQPSWSPDGTRLAFTAQRNDEFGISVINVDGTGELRLAGSEGSETPAWSKAGDRIAYSRSAFPDQAVILADVDGGARQTVADGWARSLDWSDDDAYLVAVGIADGNGNLGIVRLSTDGTDALSLTPAAPEDEQQLARWSPDGSHILFSHYFDSTDGRSRLFVIGADGSDRREVVLPAGFTGAADWLP